MNRKLKLLGANISLALAPVMVMALVMALAAQPAAAKEEINYNFEEEKTPHPFTAQTDSFNKGLSLEIKGEPTGYLDRGYIARSYLDRIPNHYANLKVVPSSSASAAWMGAGYETFGIEMIVKLEFDAMETGGCTQCQPIAYAGDTKPLKGSQFARLRGTGSLTEEWQRYKYETTVKAAQLIHIAIGWQASEGMEQDSGSVGFDNITLLIFPRP